MTSSLIRGRPRRAAAHISVRVWHAVLGGAVGVLWLLLPGMTINTEVPVAPRTAPSAPATRAAGSGLSAGAAVSKEGDASAADLVLPLVAVVAAGALAGYGYLRRTRRARTRTTPGGSPAAPPTAPAPPHPPTELDEQSRAFLAEADDWVRTSREELGLVEARFGSEAVAPFARAVRDAESELSAAFRIGRQYEAGVPADEASRRHVRAGIVGRCQEAGRRLDAEVPAFDRLRALEGESGEALTVTETWFRELAAHTSATEATLTALAKRYPHSATAQVTGYVEQAKDRLVFATTHLNQARQWADWPAPERTAHHLRAAEAAVSQATVLLTAVDRLAAELSTATTLLPAALTGAEAELAGVRGRTADDEATPAGELHARVRRADLILAAVREAMTGGSPYDPLDALRRIMAATEPLALGQAGVLSAAGFLVARSAIALADGFIETHRSAVGAEARLRLAEAGRALTADPPDHLTADTLARESRELAERDVRLHGTPLSGAARHESGVAGAVLGGILLTGAQKDGPPPSFGGPRTRARRSVPSQ
ncbi:hypothetical protein [Streptomyces sp. NPDC050287]|uniref:hypothetical protein n=1 Tax=Streptomyces sp. NPDC050287 TaxID=3365608 RepID=UPI0037A3C256